MPLTDFFRKPKDVTKEWKTAYSVDKDNNRVMFKYNKVSAAQQSKIAMLQGVYFGQDQIMIMTTSEIQFTVASKVILDDGFQYSYVSSTSLDSDDENNYMGVAGTPKKKYIVLRKPMNS
jgi:hypothetical protein